MEIFAVDCRIDIIAKIDKMAIMAKTRSVATVPATAAKNQFGQWLDKAMQGEIVVITKHEVPKAVLLSMDEYTALAGAAQSALHTLSYEFDGLLMRMQGARARKAMLAAPHHPV